MVLLKAVLGGFLFALPAFSRLGPGYKRDLSSFIETERAISLQGVLANIGPDGNLSSGAYAGVVIASPSTVNPNYLYTWSRDSALTMKMLVDELIGDGQTSLQSILEDYIGAQAVLQTIISPSGALGDGAGLGEPKFEINETAFKGSWGRPQRDGPALRAITLMSYINFLLANGGEDEATTKIWPIIANDLNYVGQYWNHTGFDLWEEVGGSSFFTLLNQHRALVEGTQMADKLGETCDACSQAPQILCFLESFWNGETVVANINTETVRSGRDANTLLAAIATFDPEGSCTDGTYQPCNSKILASHKVLVDSFRDIYTINSNASAGTAAAIGRYPEDVYYGGNPWYLCTLSAAEVLYDAIAQWNYSGSVCVDEISQPFFNDLVPSIEQDVYDANSTEFNTIISAVQTYADAFVSLIASNLPPNGSISEQFSRNASTPTPISAYDLTWSFASFVTMSQRYSLQYPSSWGSTTSVPAPPTCSSTSPNSTSYTYVPALAAGAPNVSCTVTVPFAVNASTYYGENILLTGNTTELGNGEGASGWGLSALTYPVWRIELPIPPDESVRYQYVRIESDGSYLYENVTRVVSVGACGSEPPSEVVDVWSGPVGVQPA